MSAEDDLRELLERQKQRNQSRGLGPNAARPGIDQTTRQAAEHVAQGVQRALDGRLLVPPETLQALHGLFQNGVVSAETVMTAAGLPTFSNTLEEAINERMPVDMDPSRRVEPPARRQRFQVGRQDPPPRYRNQNGDDFSAGERQAVEAFRDNPRPFGSQVVSRRNPDGTWAPTEAARHIPREAQTPDQVVAAAEERAEIRRRFQERPASEPVVSEPKVPSEDSPTAFDRLLDDDWL